MLFLLLVCTFFLLLPIYCVVFYLLSERKYDPGRSPSAVDIDFPPTSRHLPWLGSAWPILLNIIFGRKRKHSDNMEIFELLDEMHKTHGPTVVFYGVGGRKVTCSLDPAVLNHVFVKGHAQGKYGKGKNMLTQFRELFGTGIFGSEGEDWKRMRKFASSFFHTAALKQYNAVFHHHCERTCKKIENKLVNGVGNIDVQAILLDFTMDAFCDIGLGFKDLDAVLNEQQRADFQYAFEFIQTHSSRRGRMNHWWPYIEGWSPPVEFYKQLDVFNALIMKAIDEKLKESDESLSQSRDLLSRCLSMEPRPSKPEIRDFVTSFLVAGRDTTALLLSWCLHELAARPDYVDRCVEEIKAALGKSDRILDWEAAKSMPFLTAVLKETLRLHPPVPIEAYDVLVDEDVLPGNYRVRGDNERNAVVYSAYLLHRLPEVWGDDAEVFNPDSRICLGQQMAMFEAQIALSVLLKRFEFQRDPTHTVHPKRGIILSMLYGNQMVVKNKYS